MSKRSRSNDVHTPSEESELSVKRRRSSQEQTAADGNPIEDDTENSHDSSVDGSSASASENGGDAGSVSDNIARIENQSALDASRLREKGHALAGVLEKVQLNRFMSHDCFEYTLGPNVNIINGPNGSGKSAIVAAVQIGLGARAASTERAARLDDHIMFGKRDAIITMRIRNRRDPSEVDISSCNDDSSTYKWSIFGDAIIIERTLVRGGQGNWSLKDSRGKNVLNRLSGVSARREVMNICDHFGFMVENPVAVLTQAKTKAFLADCKPQQHYKLFREATLLGPLSLQLSKTAEAFRDIELILQQKRELLPIIQKQLEDLEAKYEESKEMKTLGKRIEETEAILAWTIALEEENHLHEYERVTKEEFEAELADLMERERKLAEEINSIDDEMSTADTDVQEHTKAVRDANIALQSAKNRVELRQRELFRKRREKEDGEREMEDKRARCRNAVARRDKARLEHLNSQHEKARFGQDIQDTEKEIQRTKDDLKKAEQMLAWEEDKRRSAEDETCLLERNVKSLRRAFENKRRDATTQKQFMNSANHVGRFGRHFTRVMPHLEEYVKNGQFHLPPVGPVGLYISVKDDEWAPTIQDAIGTQMLVTFLVADAHDMNVLRRLFRDVHAGTPKTILVGESGFHRARYSIPPEHSPRIRHLGHCTVMDLLDVKSDCVFNALVDHCRIESNVLVRGEENMVQVSRIKDPNIRMCWDEKGSRAYIRNGASTFRAPPADRDLRSCALTSDRAAHVAALEKAAATLNTERMQAEKDLHDHERRVSVLSRNEKNTRENLLATRQKHQTVIARRDEFENRMAAAAGEFDSTPFDEDVRAYEIDAKDAEARMKAAAATIMELNRNVDELKASETEARKRFEKLKEESKIKSERLSQIGEKLVQNRSALRRISADKKITEEKVAKAHKEIAEQRACFEKALASARALAENKPDVSDGKSSEKISSELKGMRNRLELEEERRDGKSADDIEMEYLNALKKDKENRTMLRRIEMYATALRKGLETRKAERSQIEARIKKIVRQNFNLFLMTRGHRGKITFRKNDRGEAELVITTQMAAHKTGDGELHNTKDLRSLSGGERSYTTLSFMLALGEVCQNPIRIMDEPDVFLDEASRNAAFRTLIEFCSTHLSDRQIILVTPLTLPEGVNVTDSVRIVKLSQVRRLRDSSNHQQMQTHMDAFVNT